jgi:XTP/dITP diphosphohydrolase
MLMVEKGSTPRTLVLATGNAGKVRELKDMLAPVPLKLKGLDEFPLVEEVDETGSTFYENAILKAAGFARQIGEMSLADDSGLEIEALDNAPGVYSARFAGADAGYDVKIAKLLTMLEGTGDTARRARFVCVMALAEPGGRIIHTVEATCSGTITGAPRGSQGFGYDPIFIPEGFDQTFAELDPETKSGISHRGRAAREILRYLLDFIGL